MKKKHIIESGHNLIKNKFKFIQENNKKVIKEGIRNYLSNTVKGIKEKNRLKEMSNFEKQIYFYQQGYDVLDKRFKDYINDFRYYLSKIKQGQVKSSKVKEAQLRSIKVSGGPNEL